MAAAVLGDQARHGGGGDRDEKDDDGGPAKPKRDRADADPGERGPIGGVAPVGVEQVRDDESGEHRHGKQACGPLDTGVLEQRLGKRDASELQPVATERGDENRGPDGSHRSCVSLRRRAGRSPARIATAAAAMIGSPAGANGTSPSATTSAPRATPRPRSRASYGHSRARKIAGAAASSPSAEVSIPVPISAPARVPSVHRA